MGGFLVIELSGSFSLEPVLHQPPVVRRKPFVLMCRKGRLYGAPENRVELRAADKLPHRFVQTAQFFGLKALELLGFKVGVGEPFRTRLAFRRRSAPSRRS